MQGFGLARLGRDVELRTTSNGDQVARLSLAFSYGRKGDDGKRPTTWVEGSFWGARAAALAPYLTKGTQIAVTLEEVHMETYQSNGAERTKIAARVTNIDLASGGQQPAARAPAPAPRPPAPAPSRGGSGFDDMSDDVPFIDPLSRRGLHLAM